MPTRPLTCACAFAFAFVFVFVSLVALTACVPVPTKTTTITRTLEQTGAVIAPTTPKGGGAPLREGQLTLEGGFTFATENPATNSRYRGDGSANIYNDKAMHGRIAIAPTRHIEVGFGFDYAHPSWGTVRAATDTNIHDIEGLKHFWSVTPHLLVLPYRDASGGIGLNFEADFTSITYRRDVYEKSYETTYDGGLPNKTEYLGRRITSRTWSDLYPIFRLGLIGFGHIGDLTLTGGAAIQNAPVFFGAKRADFQCTEFDNALNPDGVADVIRCEGVSDPNSVPARDSTPLYTLHFSAAYALGPVTFQAQAATHLSTHQACQRLPFRIDLALRYTFDLFSPSPSGAAFDRAYDAPTKPGSINPNHPTFAPPTRTP
jgi:hypothetical protein